MTRALFGQLGDGTFGAQISKPGTQIESAAPENFLVTDRDQVVNVAGKASFTPTATGSQDIDFYNTPTGGQFYRITTESRIQFTIPLTRVYSEMPPVLIYLDLLSNRTSPGPSTETSWTGFFLLNPQTLFADLGVLQVSYYSRDSSFYRFNGNSISADLYFYSYIDTQYNVFVINPYFTQGQGYFFELN